MSNAVMPLSDYKNTCDVIREKIGKTDKIKSGELADKVTEVYEAGKASGGGDSYYDAFWDTFQWNGNRKNYDYAFGGLGWRKDNFKPKYDIVPTSAVHMFAYAKSDATTITEDEMILMKEVEEERGIVFDFSQAASLGATFRTSLFKELNVIDLKSATDLAYVFSETTPKNAQLTHRIGLQRIERLICYDTNTFQGTSFSGNCILSYIGFEGVIASDINLRFLPLISESIQKLIGCLSDTATGKTVTLNQVAVNNAFETSSGLVDGSTSQEWLNLVATKPNWTISLST